MQTLSSPSPTRRHPRSLPIGSGDWHLPPAPQPWRAQIESKRATLRAAGGLLAPGCEENEAWGPDGAKQDPACLWEPPPPQRLVLAMLTSTAPPASPSKTSAPGTPRWGSARTRSPSTIDLNGTCMALVPRHESR